MATYFAVIDNLEVLGHAADETLVDPVRALAELILERARREFNPLYCDPLNSVNQSHPFEEQRGPEIRSVDDMLSAADWADGGWITGDLTSSDGKQSLEWNIYSLKEAQKQWDAYGDDDHDANLIRWYCRRNDIDFF